MYITAKVHKEELKSRPVVSCCGTPLNYISQWLDYKLRQVKHLVDTYTRDSEHVLQELEEMGELPANAMLFAMDASQCTPQ